MCSDSCVPHLLKKKKVNPQFTEQNVKIFHVYCCFHSLLFKVIIFTKHAVNHRRTVPTPIIKLALTGLVGFVCSQFGF